MGRNVSDTREPRHLRSLTGALLVTVGVSMWLGYAAHRAARDHRAAVESAHRDYTGMAARELARTTGEGVHWLLDEVLDDRRGRRFRVPTDLDYTDLVSRALERERCECPALADLLGGFRATGDHVEFGGGPEPAAGTAWLLRELERRPRSATHGLIESGPGTPFGGPVAIWYSSEQSRSGEPEVVDGFVSSLAGLGELIAHQYGDSRLLPPSARRTLPDDSLFYASVRTRDGTELFASAAEPPPPGASASVDTTSARWGGMEAYVDIRPSSAQASAIGGLPPSRTPLFLVMLGLVLLLGVGGLVQFRRELALSRLRNDFVSSASHELRTPLTQIRLYADLQRSGRLASDAQRQRALDVIDREAARLTTLIENILHFSGAPRVTPPLRTDELAEATDEVVSSLRLLLDANGVKLVKDLDSPLRFVATEGAYARILTNLITNAIKYGPPDQVVRITGERAEGGVLVGVEDEGPGVPVDDREAVWNRYLRLDRDIEGNQAGTGVGLAVVAELVTENGGRAWVEDAPGGGARFAFVLPEAEGDMAS